MLWSGEDGDKERDIYYRVRAFELKLIYPDRHGLPTAKSLGSVSKLRKGPSDAITLASAGFQSGDSLALTRSHHDVAPKEFNSEPPQGGFQSRSGRGPPQRPLREELALDRGGGADGAWEKKGDAMRRESRD